MELQRKERVVTPAAIIGAGAAGLAAAAALAHSGIPALVIERGDAVGMSWRGRYDRVRLNTHRRLSGLPGYTIPREHGAWPSRDAFVASLEEYARGERVQIRFATEIARIERTDSGWLLIGDTAEIAAEIVVIATGYDRTPKALRWPGLDRYSGRVLHSSEYRNARTFAGMNVLVVGTGSSGLEIAVDLAESDAAHVWIAMREPPNVLPRALFGIPLLPYIFRLMHRLPIRVADALGRFVQLAAWGADAKRMPKSTRGIASNARRPNGRPPVFDDAFIPALRRNRMTIVAGLARFDADDAVLSDGTRLQPDAVIAATGYERDLQGLLGHLDILDDDHRPRLHRRSRKAADGLYVIGFSEPPLTFLSREATAIARDAAAARKNSV